MRLFPLSFVGCLLSLALIVPAHAAGTFITNTAGGQNTCTGPMAGTTISGTLLVTGPCVLLNVTVTGAVTIVPGGSLLAFGSTFRGSITDQNSKGLNLQNDRVFGATTVDHSVSKTGVFLCSSQFGGAVSVTGAPGSFIVTFSYCGPKNQTIGGMLTVTNSPGSVILANAVGGAISVTQSSGSGVVNNVVRGNASCDASNNGYGNTAGGTDTCNKA